VAVLDITCTNIPDDGIGGIGTATTQYIDVANREHAVMETCGVRTAKAMGLRRGGVRRLARSPAHAPRARS
jgi:hypothetical protein